MRDSWDVHFLKQVQLTSNQSTCLRRKVGAVIVKNNIPLVSGFNGAPAKRPHCEAVGCLREKLNIPSGQRHEICRGAHAEQNAINFAGKYGIAIEGATLYCTTYPCSMCAKSIVNSGIKRVVYSQGYSDEFTAEILSDIEVIKIEL